jgi:serine/threonine-protein kinase
MAPEQLAGKEITIRSDIYALGLVLYELFTGRKAFDAGSLADLRRMQSESTPTSPESFMEGFDPTVERVLFQCLHREPMDRPQTALAVAAALPGGDPLAAALAAGETPSPEMVAAAGPEGGLRPGIAVACLATIVIGIAISIFITDRSSFYAVLPFVKSYAALHENARAIAREVGYDDPPADTAATFAFNLGDYFHLFAEGGPAEVYEAFGLPDQFLVYFQYRQAPGPLLPLSLNGRVSSNDPSPGPGHLHLVLDLEGKLAVLRAQPALTEDTESEPGAVDWASLFEVAGLDIDSFEPTTPTVVPRTYADLRHAWNGVLPGHADRAVRIEAASHRGMPVYFEKVISSDPYWSQEEESGTGGPGGTFVAALILLIALLVLIVGGGLFLAVRNLRLGRGDRRGAIRIALTIFSLRMIAWALGADHAGHPAILVTLAIAVCGALALGALAWLVYVAFEPYVRRLWPNAVVAWSRLLSGRFRDPLVGRDTLVGCATAAVAAVVLNGLLWLTIALEWAAPIPDTGALVALRGGRFALSEIFSTSLASLSAALGIMMLFLLCRMLVRRTWITIALLCLVWGIFMGLQFTAFSVSGGLFIGIAFGAMVFGFFSFVLIRFGLVAFTAFMITTGLLGSAPVTWNVASPGFGTGLLFVGLIVALAGYAFKTALAGRAVMQDSILGNN